MKRTGIFAKAAAVVAAVATMSALTAAVAAETYNGYLSFQTSAYSFRNEHTEATYGIGSDYFYNVIVWGNNNPDTFPELDFDYDIEGYPLEADFTDAEITGDGTYTVSVKNFDWALDGSESFNLLGVNTNIPISSGATVTGAKIIIDGNVEKTIDAPVQNPDEKEKIFILFANVWNAAVGAYDGAYPTKSLEIEFTISGLGSAPDTAGETNTDTGVESVGGIILAAAAATIVCATASKRRAK